ncbi:unnamed protein product [Fraxinus pennsylvanica]|uniref:Uncharacterized protein n=1 Tax=Fraxinus pennsylvanica TaxID=56036 RepID=A0AAD2DRN9_9LAMI|nr:unnamed protein product [Fraxinus pennsylvanica]
MISDTADKVGPDGVLSIKSLSSFETTVDMEEGMDDTCKEAIRDKQEEELLLNTENADFSIISKSIVEEEEKLIGEQLKEDEENMNEPKKKPHLNDLQFTKLDELLTHLR